MGGCYATALVAHVSLSALLIATVPLAGDTLKLSQRLDTVMLKIGTVQCRMNEEDSALL
jgi:hypothetical protein